MELELHKDDTVHIIKSYTATSILINDREYRQSILLSAADVKYIDTCHVSELQLSDFKTIIDKQPELFILGTGLSQQWPSNELLRALQERQIGVECMPTDAACRTYNVLAADRRNVLAMLLIEPEST